MKNKKIKKGEYGYIDSMRIKTLLRTVLMFLFAFVIFASGIIITGKKENIVTVISVLSILPACRSLVNLIMFLRFRSKDKSLIEKLRKLFSEKEGMTDLFPVLTFSDSIITLDKGGSYQISCFGCMKKTLIGYCDLDSKAISTVEEHLKRMLKNNGLSKVSVKIFDDKNQFIARIKDLIALYHIPAGQEIDDIFDEEKAISEELKEIKSDFETIALVNALSL